MPTVLVHTFTLIIGYLLGSLSPAALAGKLAGTDAARAGSGNLGTRNIFRILGWRWAVPVLISDLGKGALAAGLGLAVAGTVTGGMIGILGAVTGHNYSAYMGGRGGKGLAALGGGLLVLSPATLAWGLLLAGATLLLSRSVYLAAAVALLALPALVYQFLGGTWPVTVACLVAVASLLRHLDNIRALVCRTRQGSWR